MRKSNRALKYKSFLSNMEILYSALNCVLEVCFETHIENLLILGTICYQQLSGHFYKHKYRVFYRFMWVCISFRIT